MRNRRHHNNKGLRQIKRLKHLRPLQRLARKLGVKFLRE
jgi:hypothetical protein